ncbi:putative ABC transport system permease protein [Leucobacter luti]|uniref:ABC transporter permease n=1 Tax=Leucobacter luti TaxID=340320 RepID=UPI001045DF4B|nr:ABC transporter permease [Leucobacter luti]MCW2289520.1 putative ABC transport system permease protein [Leucobacter luti]TCK33869.1 putative ABC transport system permease protein [Leucobacter luti]
MTPTPAGMPPRSRLRLTDLLALSTSGLRSRPLRAILSALGIAIGIAAMVAVLGISASSQAKLQQQLDALGTNLLTVESGTDLFGRETPLPTDATGRVQRIAGVLEAAGAGEVPDTRVYRSNLIPAARSGGLSVRAADLGLRSALAAELRAGAWFTEATAAFPTVVLGSAAAQQLGIERPGSLIWLGDQQFSVVGILDPVVLAPELDTAALISSAVAQERLGFDGALTRLYVRAAEDAVPKTRELLPQTLGPEQPEAVKVSRPSDALAAKGAADETFTGLLLGLGSLGLLVGGIGVANTMIISVMERRQEIGLRRAIGARRAHIRRQFLGEALVLSALGGVFGAGLGALITLAFAGANGWPFALPLLVPGAAVGATLIVGALAGLSPAWRAARVSPTAALSG